MDVNRIDIEQGREVLVSYRDFLGTRRLKFATEDDTRTFLRIVVEAWMRADGLYMIVNFWSSRYRGYPLTFAYEDDVDRQIELSGIVHDTFGPFLNDTIESLMSPSFHHFKSEGVHRWIRVDDVHRIHPFETNSSYFHVVFYTNSRQTRTFPWMDEQTIRQFAFIKDERSMRTVLAVRRGSTRPGHPIFQHAQTRGELWDRVWGLLQERPPE